MREHFLRKIKASRKFPDLRQPFCSADLLVTVRVRIVLNIQFFCLHNFPQMTDDVDEIMSWDPPRTAPRVAAFQGADGGQTDYFIFNEKAVLCKVNTFAKAIMFWFVSHYVFNLPCFFKSLYLVCKLASFLFDINHISYFIWSFALFFV